MGLLDRFRAPKPPTRARGDSGRGHTGGFLQLEELNADLAHPQGLTIYDKMYRGDPDVRRPVRMVTNPIIGATWELEPAGGDDATPEAREIAETVRWALFEFMRPNLPGHLGEAVPLVIRSGFCPFEQVWASAERNGRTLLVPQHLGVRLPRTIHEWRPDGRGGLAAIVQYPASGAGQVELPRRDLTYYRVDAEGDNWEGVSLLRSVYKPWKLKDGFERLDAIAGEREAMGIPTVYPPSGDVPDSVRDEMETILARINQGRQPFVLMPGPKAEHLPPEMQSEGWTFEIVSHNVGSGGAGAGRSLHRSIEMHKQAIAAAFIADFMELGKHGEGARATADVQQDPFHASVEAFVSTVIEPELDDLVKRIVALNWDTDEVPRLRMSLVDSTSLVDLKDYVAGLVEKGALTPDTDLEDFLRKRADLPPANAAERAERERQREEDRDLAVEGQRRAAEGDAGRGDPATASTFGRQDRELRWFEQLMSLDRIESEIDDARARVESAAGDEARAAAREIARAAAEGRDANVGVAELEDAIADALDGLYTTGRETVREELARQRPGFRFAREDQPEGEDERTLRDRARVAAGSVLARIRSAVENRRLNRGPDLADLQAVGEREAAAALRAEAQLHAAAALNEGRSDEAADNEDDIRGSLYTSILDGRRCRPCADADDDVLRPLDDPVRVARQPPNPNCEGGGRCRCLEFFVLTDEAV